jgi:hypothetical protein
MNNLLLPTISSFLQEPAIRLNSLTSTFREHPKIAAPLQITDDGSIMMETIEIAKLSSRQDAEKALTVRKWVQHGSEWKLN